MRRLFSFFFILMAISSGVAYAATVDLDLHDYDDELMRTLDQTIKYFEPDISAGNVLASKEDADILRESYKWMETYFAKKGNAEDAVKIAQQGEEYIATASKLAAAKDFDGAADAAHSAARTCRACHDIYKPLKK
ncbi:MAG TPA: hypothetical protein VK558_15990 [Patescibacteria group bacterium]|nr:hypothetical protein [Patescibacteria group bacterium]